MTRSMAYSFARYFDEGDRELDISPGHDANRRLAKALMEGAVFCRLDRVPEDIQQVMPHVQPNFVTPFDRWGVDPYRDRFEVTLRAEGTVRGIGGLRLTGEDCSTRVEGLYACGDAATRELVAGATSGGGNQNSAWALSSGQWAGAAAAARARSEGRRSRSVALAAGAAGLRARGAARPADLVAARDLARYEMGAYDRNMFRTGADLAASLEALDGAFAEVAGHQPQSGRAALRARETAALLAAARWSKASALARAESRGMHQRLDVPATDPRFGARQRSGGLDIVWTLFEEIPDAREVAA